jgi:hypothetical protein
MAKNGKRKQRPKRTNRAALRRLLEENYKKTDGTLDLDRAAREVGVSVSSVNRWLGGMCPKNPDHRDALAHAAGLKVHQLFPGCKESDARRVHVARNRKEAKLQERIGRGRVVLGEAEPSEPATPKPQLELGLVDKKDLGHAAAVVASFAEDHVNQVIRLIEDLGFSASWTQNQRTKKVSLEVSR